MGIFSFFSNLMRKKEISLPEKFKSDIIYFVPLKNNAVELGTKIKIEHGYNLVVCYHNKVLDILRGDESEVVLEDVTVPRLFKEHRHMLVSRGIVTPKTLPADVYFVKISGHSLNFKTYEKFLCKTPNGKMKIRLRGNFDFCIKDMRKFMSVFCWEFAILRNKSLGKEISILVADEVSKILDKAELSFDIYTTCKDKVQDLILSKLSKLCVSLGINITEIKIDDLIIPKREKTLYDLALKRGQEDVFLSQVEENLNSTQKPAEKVFVTASNNEIILEQRNNLQGEDKLCEKVSTNEQNVSQFEDFGPRQNLNEETFVQKEPNLIETDESSKTIENYIADYKKEKESAVIEEKSAVNDNSPSKTVPTIKKCSRCGEKIEENSNFCKKCGLQVSEFVVCLCCGAKNVAGSEICMVCKSKL